MAAPPEKIKAWDRQPDEPAKWYGRFAIYRDLGHARTITGAYQRERDSAGRKGPDEPNRHWRKAARRWKWAERADAWDESIRKVNEAKARRTAERVLDDTWEIYEAGLRKLNEFLALPLVKSRTVRREELPDGKTIVQEIHIHPLQGVTPASLASVMAEVMKQGRLASHLEVEDWTAYTPEKLQKMTEPELRELREQLARRLVAKRGFRVVEGGGGRR